MKLSRRWLLDYVDLGSLSAKEFIDGMTMSGSKAEGYRLESDGIENVVVGKVLSVDRHPDADKLVVCQVDVGDDTPLQIVTGASNVSAGVMVPVCKNGACLPSGVKIKTGKLRGVVSQGMMCSLGELGLTKNDFPYAIEDGIFLLDEDCKPGDDICTAIGLDDTCIEFEITSNRPDCLSVLGLAREASAWFNLPLTLPAPVVKSSGGDIHQQLSVRVESPLCKRYAARMLKNVTIKPSPRWMRERLRASGVRPINNIVDITNYVMLEYGQPLHAFDVDHVLGGQIIVRTAKQGESLQTLDGVPHELSPSELVICNENQPMALAGVMGGEESGVFESTTAVVFESACFDGPAVRKAAKRMGLRTESSARFEKGLNPACCIDPLQRACELAIALNAGEVVDGMIDVQNQPIVEKTVLFEPDWINRFLGIQLSVEQMTDILHRLGFRVNGDQVCVAPYRIDIEHKADIAEEIARIYGYDRIPSSMIEGQAHAFASLEDQFARKVHRNLQAMGCSEIYTYSFISPKEYDKLCLRKDDPLRQSVAISNPLGEDTSMLRTSALPSMLKALSLNYNNRNAKAWLYEMAKVYLPKGAEVQPNEPQKIVVGLLGGCDFYTIKGIVETLLQKLHVFDYDVQPAKQMPFHDFRCAKFVKDGLELGVLGEVHPQVAENYQIGAKVYLAELDLKSLWDAKDTQTAFRPLPKFPSLTRDLCVVCDEKVPAIALEKAIRSGVGKALESLSLFDVYQGEQIGQGKKSLSYSLTLRAADRTLTDEQAGAAIRRALKNLEKEGAVLREQ